MTTQSSHWDGCHLAHFPCAKAYIAILESEVRRLRREVGYSPVPCSDVQTHDVVLKLHGEGPTWSHPTDEPPCR